MFSLDEAHPPTLEDLQRLVRANFETLWGYRFAYRELVVLLRQDELLKQRWLEVRERGFQGFYELSARFVEAGVLASTGGPEAVGEIAELCWLISSSGWLTWK